MATEKGLTAKILHVDVPEMRETFADSVHTVVWDGQSLRVDLTVTRFSEMPPGEAAQATRYPAARLVLTPQAAVDLHNRLQQTMSALVKSGLLKQQSTPAPAGNA
jgi:hypothetical protein